MNPQEKSSGQIQFYHWHKHAQHITFFTDEAWFHVSSFVNCHNYRIWSAWSVVEVPSHSIKIGGLVVKSGGRIIGQIFFNETTNAQRFQRLLGPFVNELDCVELTNGYFRQDSATPHMPQTTIHY
jgi:hypothetical protein